MMLAGLKATELQALAKAAGVSWAGSKAVIISRLTRQWDSIGNQSLRRVISIDLGYQNLAYAVVNANCELEDWRRVSVDLPAEFNPAAYAARLHDFVYEQWFPWLQQSDSLFLIERQRQRPFAGSLTPDHIFKASTHFPHE